MLIKIRWFLVLIVMLCASWLLISLDSVPDLEKEFERPVWLFNFAPENAPDFLNFKKVSGKTVYTATSGFGWSNLEGKLEYGTWVDKSLYWESTNNLNTIMRPGPDDLALSYATGPAAFTLDVEPGDYDVWILTGDWGLHEYVPYGPYGIEIEGKIAANIAATEEEFYKLYTNPVDDDTITNEEVFDRYVKPRFKWNKITVNVSDGQLSVRVVSQERDRTLLNILGNYPWSEQRSGPKKRFGGALNALIVTPVNQESQQLIERVENLRRKSFLAKLSKNPAPQRKSNVSYADLRRGYNVYFPDISDTVLPHKTHPHEEKPVNLLGTAGEYLPITFAISPNQELGPTRIILDSLIAPDGNRIEASDINVGEVRYVANTVNLRRKADWKPVPGPIVSTDKLDIKATITKQIWITIHVPDATVPGKYTGDIQILPSKGQSVRIPIELKVLPFKLERPTHLATGLTYFVPIAYAYFGQDRFWQRVQKEFSDMRRHNLTSVQLTGMGMQNYDGMDKLFSAYRNAGFEQPVYFLESASAVNSFSKKYRFNRTPDDFKEKDIFNEKYIEIINNFTIEKKRRGWPEVIINFGDEFTNDANEEFGAELASRLKQIPDVVTGADVNGFKELVLMAPHVSILAFNPGWSGPQGVNEGKQQLLHAETVKQVKDMGAIPWLVNIGKDRFSNGYYYWKMSRLGIRGKMEWIYSDFSAMPHNRFDGRGSNTSVLDAAIYPGPDDAIQSTIPYERMRQGLDDLAYLHTLEYMTENAPPGVIRDEAEKMINRIDQMVNDDFSKYMERKKDEFRWNEVRYNKLRHEISEMIMKLKNHSAPQLTP
jgi:hypothetical protein